MIPFKKQNKMKSIKLIILNLVLLASCSKGSDDGPAPDPDPVASPTASTLVFS